MWKRGRWIIQPNIPLQHKAAFPNDGDHNSVYIDNQVAVLGLEGIKLISFIHFMFWWICLKICRNKLKIDIVNRHDPRLICWCTFCKNLFSRNSNRLFMFNKSKAVSGTLGSTSLFGRAALRREASFPEHFSQCERSHDRGGGACWW